MYETFGHTADIGIRARAADLPTLFAEAGHALVSILVSNPEQIRPREQRTFRVASDGGAQLEYLLVDWLNELLYAFNSERFLGCQFQITLDDAGLEAFVQGEPAEVDRHRLDHEIKAITYHGLKVEQAAEGGWTAEVILDL